MLALRQVQERNDARLFVVVGVFAQDGFNPCIVLLAEVKLLVKGIVGSVDVLQ